MNDLPPALKISPSRSPGTASVLGPLVAPDTAERFLREYWPDRVFHAHGPVSRLPALFSSPPLLNFRMLASQYRGRLGFGRGSKSSRMITMAEASPAHLYEMGLSVYLPDLEQCVPSAETFLRALERDLGVEEMCCHITVWASPQDDGASTHFDAEDVISVQLEGTKQFDVARVAEYACPYGSQFGPGGAAFDEMYPQIENGFPEPDNVQFETIEMKPGSVLFVPRGTWHRTRAEADSFSISIGIRPPCAVDLFLEQLRFVLLQDPEWRRPLYGAHGSVAQRREAFERAQRVLDTAPAAVGAISPADLALPAEAERLKNVERATRFLRDLRTRMVFEPGQGAEIVNVMAWTREIGEHNTLKMNVPPPYAPVFRWLAESRAPFSAGELADRFPDVAYEQHQKLLDVLTRARYLRLLWFPRLPKP